MSGTFVHFPIYNYIALSFPREKFSIVIIVFFFQALKEFLCFSEGEVRTLASLYAAVVLAPTIAIG